MLGLAWTGVTGFHSSLLHCSTLSHAWIVRRRQAVQRSTAQYSTVQSSTVLYSTLTLLDTTLPYPNLSGIRPLTLVLPRYSLQTQSLPSLFFPLTLLLLLLLSFIIQPTTNSLPFSAINAFVPCRRPPFSSAFCLFRLLFTSGIHSFFSPSILSISPVGARQKEEKASIARPRHITRLIIPHQQPTFLTTSHLTDDNRSIKFDADRGGLNATYLVLVVSP